MRERTLHFGALTQEAVGRDIPHILLLHMNRINADHLSALLDWYAAEGWNFVAIEDALPDIYAGPRGLSQIERVMGRKSE